MYYEKYFPCSISFLLLGNKKLLAQNVGIGTTRPLEKLEVVGNVKAGLFTSPKTCYYSVNEAAFRPGSGSEPVMTGLNNGGTYITNGFNYRLTAPVNLPQGATIDQITVHFYDASATQDHVADLLNEFSSGYSFIAVINSSGSAGLNI